MSVLTLLGCGLVLTVLASDDSLTAYFEDILELFLQSCCFEIILGDVHNCKEVLLGILLILALCKILRTILLKSIYADCPSILLLQVTEYII
jgi:hypothetical protein